MEMKELYNLTNEEILTKIAGTIMDDRTQNGPLGNPTDVWNMVAYSDGEASINDMIEELASRL